MILIIGTTPDDIIYYKNRMRIKEQGLISANYPYYVGRLANKDVCLTYTGYSNIASGVIAGYMIEKFSPYIVIITGAASTINLKAKQSDLFIAEKIYLGDVDLTSLADVRYGQIENLPPFYSSDEDYIRMIETINSKTENRHLLRGPLISTNVFFNEEKKAEKVLKDQFGNIESMTAFDTEAGGIVTACGIYSVPWLLLKVINYHVGDEMEFISSPRISVEAQPQIGYIIETLLLELVHSFNNI
ncbi:MAG: 5'-methylthioadenosine/S-adenosylhomocysteine nucleosidase [Bacilli bacterium]|jgi:5'-methylthioadenosine/S-adenosylhomocysteine nucleosidase|nr:5'-methylthioadenosine/S-adenosylhomocysteine nucleosidase [Bacilli bacterium]MDD3389557.1 5'-methylthioadenosine/S-adenosylhomocysteine nucleosidase [Bacilli bacterium]MDD4345164.1 5'-methylthioadenosine/S-adenosylhomocysteine nucleosidase [Bacilli bacterium]MDD4521068.1 5'-methylthioadenosine/S-adenosylhomocysteine nucleosidase [Bacilli bacterium]MDY0400002.1 5'-methylthioadenosine/S-adenosylhomocysteine nucleosidase [Bacilli bacterium]